MGQSKISLKELVSVRRRTTESTDDYLNRFKLIKTRCFTLKHELAKMTAGGLDYSIRKKLDTQYLRDMAQLTDKVRQVERLRAEKATHKFRREKVPYVDSNESDQEFDIACVDVKHDEVNFTELKPGTPYTCKVLRPSEGRNPVETQNDKYTPKTYKFDVTKCDEIFYPIVADGQMAVSNGLKIPPLEQRKKRG
jgi:hypothetical protein